MTAMSQCSASALDALGDLEDVLPLFANQSEIGGIGLCYKKDGACCIRTGKGISKEWLLSQLSKTAKETGRFVMFDLKAALPL